MDQAVRSLYGEISFKDNGSTASIEKLNSEMTALAGSVDKSIIETTNSMQDLEKEFFKLGESSVDLDRTEKRSSAITKTFGDLKKSGQEAVFGLSQGFKDMLGALTVFGIAEKIGSEIFTWVKGTEEFKEASAELAEIAKPLTDLLQQIGIYLIKYLASALMVVVKPLSEFVFWLSEAEAGIAYLKIAAIFVAPILTGILIPILYGLGTAALSVASSFITMAASWIIAMAPVIAISAAIAALVLVIEDLFVFAEGGGSLFEDVLKSMGFSAEEINNIRMELKGFFDFISSSWNTIKDVFVSLIPEFKLIIATIWNLTKNYYMFIYKLTYGLVNIFQGVWKIIHGIFTGNFDEIVSGFKKLGEGIERIFTGIWDFVQGLFSGIGSLVDSAVGIYNKITGGSSAPVTKVQDAIITKSGQVIQTAPEDNIFVTKSNEGFGYNPGTSSGKSSSIMIQSLIGELNITVTGPAEIGSVIKEKVMDAVNELSRTILRTELGLETS